VKRKQKKLQRSFWKNFGSQKSAGYYLGAGAANGSGVGISLGVAVAGGGGDGAERGAGVGAGDGEAEGGLVRLAFVQLDGEVDSGANYG